MGLFTETIRPTAAFQGVSNSWSNPPYAWDNDPITSCATINGVRSPSISFGGASNNESINSWGAKVHNWTDAIIYVTFSKTQGSNDYTGIFVYDKVTGTNIHTLLPNTVSAVTKQTFSVALNPSNWGGNGFPNIDNLRVRVNCPTVGSRDNVVSRIFEVYIDGGYGYDSVSIDTGWKNYSGKLVNSGWVDRNSVSFDLGCVVYGANNRLIGWKNFGLVIKDINWVTWDGVVCSAGWRNFSVKNTNVSWKVFGLLNKSFSWINWAKTDIRISHKVWDAKALGLSWFIWNGKDFMLSWQNSAGFSLPLSWIVWGKRDLLVDWGSFHKVILESGWVNYSHSLLPSVWQIWGKKYASMGWRDLSVVEIPVKWNVIAEKWLPVGWKIFRDKLLFAGWIDRAAVNLLVGWRGFASIPCNVSWKALAGTFNGVSINVGWKSIGISNLSVGCVVLNALYRPASWKIFSGKELGADWRLLQGVLMDNGYKIHSVMHKQIGYRLRGVNVLLADYAIISGDFVSFGVCSASDMGSKVLLSIGDNSPFNVSAIDIGYEGLAVNDKSDYGVIVSDGNNVSLAVCDSI